MSSVTGQFTAPRAEPEPTTVDADIFVYMCVLIYVNRCYNGHIDIRWSIRQ